MDVRELDRSFSNLVDSGQLPPSGGVSAIPSPVRGYICT